MQCAQQGHVPVPFVFSKLIFSVAGVMNKRKVDEISWAWAAEYLVDPGVILMMFGTAVPPCLLSEFDEDHAILLFFVTEVQTFTVQPGTD